MTKKRIAIIGCKNMGRKHLDVLRRCFGDDVEISGIINSNPESSKIAAEELGVPFFEDISQISKDNTDAVIISSPAQCHLEQTLAILGKNIPCLVEKPMAMNEAECDALIKAEANSEAFVMVGHTENYNPAVVELKKHLKNEIFSIKGLRCSPNVIRERTTNVIPELMIHDLAIISDLIKSNVKSSKVKKNNKFNWTQNAVVNIEYQNGAKVEIEGLIDHGRREKFMKIEDCKNNKFHIDFVNKTLNINGKEIAVAGESLKEELGAFLNRIDNPSQEITTAKEGKKNVLICSKLEEQCVASDIISNEIIQKKIKEI
ncbi:MAG: Gfo/Idh/MocA family oxidoreductase [Alphaproteobacteria bacterium]